MTGIVRMTRMLRFIIILIVNFGKVFSERSQVPLRLFTLRAATRLVQRGVSKGVEDSRRPTVLWAGHPRNGRKAFLEVTRSQGVEGSGMAGLGETLGSP
jgi:hypothetical protein